VRKLFAVLSASALLMVGPAAPFAGASHHLRMHNKGGNHNQGQSQGQTQGQTQGQRQCILVLGILNSQPVGC
jgi:hypothetical protein